MYQFSPTNEIITCLPELLKAVGLESSNNLSIDKAIDIQPIRVTRHFANRIERGNNSDPLLRQVMPSADELCCPDDFTRNPLKEQETTRQNLLTKYAGRVLILTTPVCSGGCRFCFRRFYQSKPVIISESAVYNQGLDNSTCQIKNISLASKKNDFSCPTLIPHLIPAIDYIREKSDIHEVILSGGDPLMLDNNQLNELLSRLGSIEHLKRVRFHSRMPIFYPPRIDSGLLEILGRCPKPIIFVVHANHANEIDAQVESALASLKAAGAMLFHQGVLLKGVNDSAESLCALFNKMVDCSVVPYYLHVLDHVEGAAHFLVDDSTAKNLITQVRNLLPGYCVPRLARELPCEKSKTILL